MANDPKNIRLGPCRVRWGGVDLGLTKGGVQVEVATTTKEVTVDQYGETPVNEYITGRTLTVTCPFAETDIDTLHQLFSTAGATRVGYGTFATGSLTIGTVNPLNGAQFSMNGVQFTLRAAAGAVVAGTDIQLGSSPVLTARNILLALQMSTNPAIAVARYTLNAVNPRVIDIAYGIDGAVGNTFALVGGTNLVISGATLTGGTDGPAGGRKRVDISSAVGTSLYATAKELVLRPQEQLDYQFSEDFIVPLAGSSGNLQFSYELNTERLFNLTFKGYPNTVDGLLFRYGDRMA